MNGILDKIGKLEDRQRSGLAIIIVALIALYPPVAVMGIILIILYIAAKVSIPLTNGYEKCKEVLNGRNFNGSIKELTPRREPIPERVKMYVWKRDDGRCAYCKSNKKLEYDHIIPVSKGGSNTARNIQLLCERCNRSKSAKIGLEEYF